VTNRPKILSPNVIKEPHGRSKITNWGFKTLMIKEPQNQTAKT